MHCAGQFFVKLEISNSLSGYSLPYTVIIKFITNLSTGGWKRARLKQDIHHSLAYIQLIDYGSDEQVPETALHSLPYELGM